MCEVSVSTVKNSLKFFYFLSLGHLGSWGAEKAVSFKGDDAGQGGRNFGL